jgi:sRNA-binding regulator protein Hfq
MLALCFVAIVNAGTVHAQKNDTIYLQNGDKITGELKKYESGVFILKTTGLGTLNIEYDVVKTIHSNKSFEIVKKTGFSYYGSICSRAEPGMVGVVITNDTVDEPIGSIVGITWIKNRFWRKFDGSIELGFSYFKSTNNLQYYVNSEVNFRARKDYISLDISLLQSKQKVEDTLIKTKNNNYQLDYNHFFQGRWWGMVGTRFQQNSELDLDYRVQLGAGAGYDIIHTNPVRFYLMGGLLVNRELPTDSAQFNTNYEGMTSMKFTWLRHRNPEVNVSTHLDFFPSFTISGRYRLDYDISVKFEVIRDLFINLSLYDSYDSKPAGGTGALNDWNVIFSVGYSF